jgi:hypothetical protein
MKVLDEMLGFGTQKESGERGFKKLEGLYFIQESLL